MPKMSEIKKKAKELGFVEEMERLGFTLGPGDLWFYRFRGEYLDVIAFWGDSSQEWVDVPIVCYRKDLVDFCDMSEFPRKFVGKMHLYSSAFVNEDGVEVGAPLSWKVATDAEMEKTFSALEQLIKAKADGWLKNIDSDEKLWESIAVVVQEGSYGQKMKKLLLGKG